MTKKAPSEKHSIRVMVNFTPAEMARVLAFAARMQLLANGVEYSRADAVRQLVTRALDAMDRAPTSAK